MEASAPTSTGTAMRPGPGGKSPRLPSHPDWGRDGLDLEERAPGHLPTQPGGGMACTWRKEPQAAFPPSLGEGWPGPGGKSPRPPSYPAWGREVNPRVSVSGAQPSTTAGLVETLPSSKSGFPNM